ncbi:MAG: conjugative relaxase [Aquificota bacterium]|nr:MAG: conjugative relaxase [Aquificota bacterium]
MMLSAKILKRANFSYYLREEEKVRHWFYGGLAQELGLPSEPNRDLLLSLTKLRGDKKEGGRIGIDLSFSPPKSVSLTYAVGDIDTKREILQAHEQAVEEVLNYIETNIKTTRRRQGKRRERITGKLVFACFTHELSRANDPQMHTHALLLNAVKRDDGKYSALELYEVLIRIKELGRMYREKLMQNLQELGYEIVIIDTQNLYFEIATVPQQLIDKFSQRDRQIKSYMKQGIPKKVAIYLNRPPKSEPNPELWNTKLVGIRKELFEQVQNLSFEERKQKQRLKEIQELRKKQEREWEEQKRRQEEELEKARRELESARRERERVWKEIEERYIELVAELSLLEQELQKKKPRTQKELQDYWNRANEIKQEMDKLQTETPTEPSTEERPWLNVFEALERLLKKQQENREKQNRPDGGWAPGM